MYIFNSKNEVFINTFSTTQSIIGNDSFITIGENSQLSGIFFSYDQNITTAFVMSTFKILHNGTSGSSIFPNYEIAYYNEFQNQQSYEDVSGMPSDFQKKIQNIRYHINLFWETVLIE